MLQYGKHFIYDVDILGVDGLVHERWRGLKLQAVGKPIPSPLWRLSSGHIWNAVFEISFEARSLYRLAPGSNPRTGQVRSDRAIHAVVGKRTL